VYNGVAKGGGPRSPGPGAVPIGMLSRTAIRTNNKQFKIFWLNFSWDMSKMLLVTKFHKSPFLDLNFINLRFWWPKVARFGQIVFFKLIITKSNFRKNQLWRHFSEHHKIFLFWILLFFYFSISIKIAGYTSGCIIKKNESDNNNN